MGILTILLTAVALAMDAFAVSLSSGMCIRNFRPGHAVKMGLYFGFFQAGMTIAGWFLSDRFRAQIEAFDHWIAFILLGIVGARMIKDSCSGDGHDAMPSVAETALAPGKMLILSVATSIDALAAGISFALFDVDVFLSAAIIGVVAFLFSFVGGMVGRRAGSMLGSKCEFVGGVILILIGTKILVEHLGILS